MERNGLQFFINKYNIPQYLPPVEKESNFYVDLHSIILEKDSVYELYINRM